MCETALKTHLSPVFFSLSGNAKIVTCFGSFFKVRRTLNNNFFDILFKICEYFHRFIPYWSSVKLTVVTSQDQNITHDFSQEKGIGSGFTVFSRFRTVQGAPEGPPRRTNIHTAIRFQETDS